MKKRSMLAIASLATGFVVAAVSPSHAHEDDPALPHGPAAPDGPAVIDGPAVLHGPAVLGSNPAVVHSPAVLDVDETIGTVDPVLAREFRMAMDDTPHVKKGKGKIG
ncbi:hypothetical protein [Streptomyces sp. GESEQ-35]|uniref:hypothetical protein n=1 Tax=Streptomyces sp. GESEQ-35 TaxID=2812657 RepID=UPI001B33A9AA|nr:hypothetical protein [Streptomyces sp. GESEQ-35]